MASLKKNFVYSIAYQILIIFLPLITAPYVTRVLGADGLGEYTYTHSIVNYIILMAMLGISQHGNRSIAGEKNNLQQRSLNFWSIYSVQIFTHLVVLLGYVLYLVFFVGNRSLIPWLQLIYLASSLFDISWMFFGMEQFQLTVIRNTIIKIATVVLIFALVHKPSDLWIYTLIMTTGTFVSQIYLWLYIKKNVVLKRPDFQYIKQQIKPILILFLPVLAYSIYKVMDKIMLGAMTDYAQVAYYENAFKINSIPIGLITAVGNVMLPRTTAMIAEGKGKESAHYFVKTFFWVNLVSTALVFGLAAVSSDFIVLYYGEEFRVSSSILVCLNWTIYFISWANIMRTQYLIPYKKDKVYVSSTLIGAAVNLILNIILIPRIYAMGAAIGTLFAEFSVMFVQFLFVRKEMPVGKSMANSFFYFLDGIVMLIVVRLCRGLVGSDIIGLLLQILIGGCVFVLLAVIIACVRKDDFYQLLYKLIKKKQKKRG